MPATPEAPMEDCRFGANPDILQFQVVLRRRHHVVREEIVPLDAQLLLVNPWERKGIGEDSCASRQWRRKVRLVAWALRRWAPLGQRQPVVLEPESVLGSRSDGVLSIHSIESEEILAGGYG